MSWTRRSFLTAGTGVAAGAFLSGRRAHASTLRGILDTRGAFADRRPADSPDFRALAARALEAAKQSGATYADVQFRTRYTETWVVSPESWNLQSYFNPVVNVTTGAGVRALYHGYWGFSGFDGDVTPDEMAAAGRGAMAQAKVAATGKPRETELAPRPVVADAHWSTPIEVDPFVVSDAEKIDIMLAMRDDIDRYRFVSRPIYQATVTFVKEERTVATMDGSFFSQTQYVIDPRYGVQVVPHPITDNPGMRYDPFIGPAGAGWEYLLQYPYRDRLDEITEEALRLRMAEEMDVGRYDVVFDAASIAAMTRTTLATATEGDRAMGYLANGAGTSFLSDPLEMLGTFQVGSPLVTLSANRSMPKGCATVRWDDEGVVPAETTLVKNGIVTDLQTTREAASWLAPYYQKKGMPVRSTGCAGTSKITEPLTQVPPNLVLAPGTNDVDFRDMVRSIKKGVAVVSGNVRSDFQGLTGIGTGTLCYEVKDGVMGTVLAGCGWNFRTPEFWKSATALGGAKSVKAFGFPYRRNRNDIPNYFTISAVPMVVPNLPFVKSSGR